MTQLFQKIWEDMQEPVSYLPMGALAGVLFLSGYRVFQAVVPGRKPQSREGQRGKGSRKVPGYCSRGAKPAAWFFCIVYVTVLLNMVFFSREPGSRTDVELKLFGTWGNTMIAHRFVLENVMMFFPFGVLFPCVIPCFRKGRWCVLGACLVGIGIEWIQYLTRTGYCQTDDVVANTLGAWAGWIVYRIGLTLSLLWGKMASEQV